MHTPSGFTLAAGDTGHVAAKVGTDGETVKSPDGNSQPVNNGIDFSVPANSSNAPHLVSASAGSASTTIVLTYDQAIQPNCATVVADWTITITGLGAFTPSAVSCPGVSSNVTLTLPTPPTTFTAGQSGKVEYKAGGAGHVKGLTSSTNSVDPDSVSFVVTG
jgi:hypothetical protein